MTWVSFCNYIIMREFGKPDAIVRNYKLDVYAYRDNNTHVNTAYLRMGFPHVRGMGWFTTVAEVRQKLINTGVTLSHDLVRVRMNEWYLWDRIRKGDLQRGGRYLNTAPSLVETA